jgi:UDP-glucose:(glucosyl)LPS alpha-1,2-glucosyltransferase
MTEHEEARMLDEGCPNEPEEAIILGGVHAGMTESAYKALPPTPPMGGSELILANVRSAFPDIFPDSADPSQDKVQVIVSRPQKVLLNPDKPKLLWLQDLPGDPEAQCLADPTYRSQFNRIVCVSHWQEQQYNAVLRIPYSELTVIKNAVPHLTGTVPKRMTGDKLRFIYTSTPHRGLPILAAVADTLVKERQDWELHVYSSLHIYGWHDQDKQFEPLYDQLRANECVTYFGSQPNDIVRQAVRDAHVFVYPAIYMETSCMALQEAMMAGCLAITTNIGALPETCAEWAWMMSVDEQGEVIAQRTLQYMRQALDRYESNVVQMHLRMQSWYYQQFWSLEARLPVWKHVLDACVAEGPKQEMLVIQ